MSAKVFVAALLGMCWSLYAVQGQGTYQPGTPPAPVPVPKEATPAQPGTQTADEGRTGLSSWITYDRDNCCIGPGGGVPVLTEVFFRVGPSAPIGGEFFGRNLAAGWMVEGGARALFFDNAWKAAWTVELGVTNDYNPGHGDNTTLLVHDVPALPAAGIKADTPVRVSVHSLNRTFADLGLGREWYVWAPADAPESRLRMGADFGGRWGSATVRFIGPQPAPPHHQQVCEAVYAAIHSDFEWSCGRWTFLAGLRLEYSFTWSNIFDTGRGNMQDLVALVNLGVRY
jgi:hypothetical protein